ncbi:WD40 repeat-like protein, partial [Dacryopinax primogenitus]
ESTGWVCFVIEGHNFWVNSVMFSPHGSQIVSGSHNNTNKVWNMQMGAAISLPMEGHTSIVYSVMFLPNSSQIVSGAGNKTIRLWH